MSCSTSLPTIDHAVLEEAAFRGQIELEYASEMPGALVVISHSRQHLRFQDRISGAWVDVPSGGRLLVSSPNVNPRAVQGGKRTRWDLLADPQEVFGGLI